MDLYQKFESVVLPNGLTIYAAPWQGAAWQYVYFVIHSGAENDPIGMEGMAHFVEHLVSENATETIRKMDNFFKDCGSKVDFGTTEWSCVSYSFSLPADAKAMAKALSHFGSMLISANLKKHVERERRIISAEFKGDYLTAVKLDMETREQRAVFAGLWPERMPSPLGSFDSIQAITQEGLQDYYDDNYNPANISVVTVGGFKLVEMKELLLKSPFNEKKKGARTAIPEPLTQFDKLTENRHIYTIPADMPVGERLLAGRFRSVAKIPGNVRVQAVHILSDMLDLALYDKVREEYTWTYKIKAVWDNLRMCFRFPINCDAVHPEAMDEINDAVTGCIDSLADGGNGLFDEIHDQEIKKRPMLDLSGGDLCLEAADHVGQYHRIITRTEYYDAMESVTKNEVIGLLEHLRPERRWTLLVKP